MTSISQEVTKLVVEGSTLYNKIRYIRRYRIFYLVVYTPSLLWIFDAKLQELGWIKIIAKAYTIENIELILEWRRKSNPYLDLILTKLERTKEIAVNFSLEAKQKELPNKLYYFTIYKYPTTISGILLMANEGSFYCELILNKYTLSKRFIIDYLPKDIILILIDIIFNIELRYIILNYGTICNDIGNKSIRLFDRLIDTK